MIPKPDKNSKDYTSATIGVPVTLGHRYCVPKAPCPFVPKRMGWLWTARNIPAHPFDPAWRPGCVRRGILGKPIFKLKKRVGKARYKLQRFGEPPKKSRSKGATGVKSKSSVRSGKGVKSKSSTRSLKGSKLSTKMSKASKLSSSTIEPVASKSSKKLQKKSSKSVLSKKKIGLIESDSESEEEGIKPMFLLQKKEGNLRMTLQQLKNPLTRTKVDLPYDDSVPPFVLNVSNDPNDQMADREKKFRKAKRRRIQRRILFEQAIDTICKQLYQNIDQDKIREEADLTHRCPCSCIQDYVLKYLSKIYASIKPGEKGEANVLQSIIEEEGLLRIEPKAPEVTSSDDDWTVEFTPTCAMYDPVVKITERKHAEIQTIRPKTDDSNIFSKSIMSLK